MIGLTARKFMLILLTLLAGVLYADDYKWDLVNALANSDFQKIETIVKSNIDTMSDKRLLMSFILTYSYGETTIKTFNLLLGEPVPKLG